MIRIGHTWVDMNAVSAICENRSESGYSMFLNSGRIIGLPDITEEEVVEVLVRCGLIDSCEVGIDMAVFTVDELAELEETFRHGLRWIAQDVDGKNFAYLHKPEKRSHGWVAAGTQAFRLKAGDYDALSYEDAEPVDLKELFTQGDDEDAGTD